MNYEERLAEQIRLNKETRRQKHTTATTFKKGMAPMKGAGRRRGSKNDPKKIAVKQMKKVAEEIAMRLLAGIDFDDLDKLSVKDKFANWAIVSKYITDLEKAKSLKQAENVINKIEVSFGTPSSTNNIIDVTHEEVDNNKIDNYE